MFTRMNSRAARPFRHRLPRNAPAFCRAPITQDITLTNDTYWVLNGGVLIGNKAAIGDPVPTDGPTLYIEAGTRILGAGGAGNALYIQRGARIVAQGQPNAPIVMTGGKSASEGAAPPTGVGWSSTALRRSIPATRVFVKPWAKATAARTAVTDPQDNSGVLRYVRVQFAGELINDEDELNGIAFQGVGNGTTVDYVQVHGTADDCIEFFGGTVNVKHLVLSDCQDDSIDWTQG